MGSTRVKWTDELIKEKILEAKEGLELDRMPSRKEVVDFFRSESLANAVSKRQGGWHGLAEELGLDIKESESYFGKRNELAAADMLRERGFEVRRMPHTFPYDLLLNDCVKVDVKSGHLYKGPNGSFYSFNLEKSYATCDFYILFTINEDNTIGRKMIVPSNAVIANKQISVGVERSKYHKYTDRWDLLDNAAEFWDKIDDATAG